MTDIEDPAVKQGAQALYGPVPGQLTLDELIAAALVAPRTGTQRARVLEALRGMREWGCTDYELWNHHGIGARPHVPGTRREELIADGWPIVDSGRRRPTDTGAPAIVWVLEAAP